MEEALRLPRGETDYDKNAYNFPFLWYHIPPRSSTSSLVNALKQQLIDLNNTGTK